MASEQPVVLAVDDDEEVLGTYEIWLFDTATLRTATGGKEALDNLDESVDVVLLDRMMSGMSGRDVLEQIRERAADPQVVMVTAVDPDFRIAEIPVDDYLPKPMDEQTLVDMIEKLRRRRQYDDDVQTYLRLRSVRSTLEATKDTTSLEQSDVYTRLCERIEALETDIAERLDKIDDVEALV